MLGALVTLPTTASANSNPAAPAADPPSYPVVAQGLNNPRHLGFSSNGSLYVAESGSGGRRPCLTNSEGSRVCYGSSGAITKVTHSRHHWRQHRVLTGLPSLAGADGSQATGPSDIDVRANRDFVISVGLGAPPNARKDLGHAGRHFGTLLKGRFWRHHHRSWRHHHGLRVLADIAGHENRTNPVDGPDSNPASVLRRGSHWVVADAGGNTVVRANRWGRMRTLASFPDGLDQPPSLSFMQFVPTSVAIGPDGAYYISQLTGGPFPKDGAKIYRLVPGHKPTVYATGLTNVTDLAFGRDGSLYAVEISAGGLASTGPIGALVKVAPVGHGSNTVVAGGLFAPYGVALRHGSAYVTTGSVATGAGQVVRIPLG